MFFNRLWSCCNTNPILVQRFLFAERSEFNMNICKMLETDGDLCCMVRFLCHATAYAVCPIINQHCNIVMLRQNVEHIIICPRYRMYEDDMSSISGHNTKNTNLYNNGWNSTHEMTETQPYDTAEPRPYENLVCTLRLNPYLSYSEMQSHFNILWDENRLLARACAWTVVWLKQFSVAHCVLLRKMYCYRNSHLTIY